MTRESNLQVPRPQNNSAPRSKATQTKSKGWNTAELTGRPPARPRLHPWKTCVLGPPEESDLPGARLPGLLWTQRSPGQRPRSAFLRKSAVRCAPRPNLHTRATRHPARVSAVVGARGTSRLQTHCGSATGASPAARPHRKKTTPGIRMIHPRLPCRSTRVRQTFGRTAFSSAMLEKSWASQSFLRHYARACRQPVLR